MQEPKEHRSNRVRTAQTQAALIKAARELFVEKGFAGTATTEIVKAANVTRGALYHHFEDKEDLFAAVIEQEWKQVSQEIAESALNASTPMEALIAGSRVYLQAMVKPGRTRLLLVEAMSVLGTEKAHRIDWESSTRELYKGLEAAQKAGEIPASLPLKELTLLLASAFDRAAVDIEKGADLNAHMQVLEAMMRGLIGTKEMNDLRDR